MNTQNTTVKDKLYALIEMQDSMKKSIDNAITVIDDQKRLIKLLEEHDSDKHFEKFINDLKEQTKNMSAQISTLTKRHTFLSFVVDECSKDTEQSRATKNVCMKLLDALGVFER